MQTRLSGVTSHAAPDPDWTCGLYAYANPAAAAEHPNSRHVLAVIACWDASSPGTRGLRAEHARIEAIWMSPKVPPNLAIQVAGRYPAVRTYDRPSVMFAEHPLTELNCYQPDAQAERAINASGYAPPSLWRSCWECCPRTGSAATATAASSGRSS
jgi:hypothetical protein